MRSEAGDIQHDGVLAGAEGLKEFLSDDGGAEDVDLKTGPPFLKVLLDKGTFVGEVAGVVDEDVGSAEGVEDGADGRGGGDVGGVG